MLGILLTQAAFGCGGLFCNSISYDSTPVNQAVEEILFAVNEDEGTVTTHVKIFFEGDAADFSWVVPVPEIPEIEIGTNAFFDALDRTRGEWHKQEIYDCQTDLGDSSSPPASGTVASTYSAGTTSSYFGVSGVEIVDTKAVGPYETVTLTAEDSTALTLWLSVNDYDIPAGFDPAVAPYVAGEGAFVAMRLANTAEVDDMEPLVMTYASTKAGIPLTLTSVAAVPDMRLRVYVLGEHRAVPENYLHVTLNHMALDWWDDGSNHEDVVATAADEAGGHAFATDYAGPGEFLVDGLWSDDWDQLDLASAENAYEFLVTISTSGIPVDGALSRVLEDVIPLPQDLIDNGTTLADIVHCLVCHESHLTEVELDATAAADEVEAWVLAPRRNAAGLLRDYPTLTRLMSSASPNEMTLDPEFVFNADMAQNLSNRRTATERILCDGTSADTGTREFETWDGRVALLPSRSDLRAQGLTEMDILAPLALPAAASIEQTSASGEPEVLVDNSEQLENAVDELNDQISKEYNLEGHGCGCNGSPGPLSAAWLLPLLALRRRT